MMPYTDDVIREAAVLVADPDTFIDPDTDAGQLALTALDADSRGVMDDLAEYANAGYVPSGKTGPRVSDYGGCPRAVWYREHPPAVLDEVDDSAAVLGTLLHLAFRAARQTRYPWRRYEMQVDVPGLDKPGKIDEYDGVLGVVDDLKSVGRNRWEMIGDAGPLPSAWGQLLIYAYALSVAGYPVRVLRIHVLNRDTGQVEVFERPYDTVARADAKAALESLIDLATDLDLGMVPPRGGNGPSRFPCSYCPFRSDCWNTAAATAAGRSPASYTTLGPDQDEPMIVWAAEQLITARSTRLGADKDVTLYKDLLDGIPPGEYGRVIDGEYRKVVEVVREWNTSTGYKAAFEQARDLLTLPAHMQPAPDTIEAQTSRTPYTSAKRVRAAKKRTSKGR